MGREPIERILEIIATEERVVVGEYTLDIGVAIAGEHFIVVLGQNDTVELSLDHSRAGPLLAAIRQETGAAVCLAFGVGTGTVSVVHYPRDLEGVDLYSWERTPPLRPGVLGRVDSFLDVLLTRLPYAPHLNPVVGSYLHRDSVP